ncbi:MAG TPA: hypothetical protein VFC05_08845 [Nitrososphaeraceae archaeon]|nr:hypothetical protein [Nitrososphaeraceae archaeon]
MDNAINFFARNQKPLGKTWEQWTREWWQWLLSYPKEINPAYQGTGLNFAIHNNVIFLAGVDSTIGPVERNITIPSQKPILFPIINFITSYLEDPKIKCDEDLISSTKSNIDDIRIKQARVDDINITAGYETRVFSNIFTLYFPPNNLYDIESGYTRACADGYWCFLESLAPGEHTIHTFGSCLAGRIKIESTYYLNVTK